MMGAFCNIEGAYALRAVNKETAEAEAQNLPTAEEAERIDALIACYIAVLEEQPASRDTAGAAALEIAHASPSADRGGGVQVEVSST
ncbi:MAG: hypothetical protein OXJ55_13570 [Caldilineaceae bacterium]|nr:hypothetical protein [Caldilineaceae bacterium]MDE0461678.1 hypothetical protein [Caldilineaceae bacterium]